MTDFYRMALIQFILLGKLGKYIYNKERKNYKIITIVAEAVDVSYIPLAHTIPTCIHSLLLLERIGKLLLKAFSGL